VNITEIERCERGVERAVLQTDTRQAMKTYYTECSGVYTEAGCKQAYIAAAEVEPSQQMVKVLEGCRAAYCPKFPNQELEACKADFKPTGESIVRSWPPLHEAILERDAKGYAPRVSRAMLVFYSRVLQRQGGMPGVTSGSPMAAPPPQAPSNTGDGSAPSATADAAAAPAAAADAGRLKSASK